MTLSNAVSREPTYTGNGATSVYAFTFPVFASSELQVTKATNDTTPVVTTLVLTTDYTVTLSSTSLPSAGSITLVAGNLTSGYKLSIRRVRPFTQANDLVNEGAFFAATHESEFDKLVMQDQQNADDNARSLRLPEVESGTALATILPDATTRASKYLFWDSSGNPTAAGQSSLGGATTTAYTLTLLDDANAATARATLGFTGASGTVAGAQIDTKAVAASNLASSAISQVFQARLTTQTATPVTVADRLAQTTVFVTPYGGDKISLYDGTDWRYFTLAEVSAAVPGSTNTNYDVFIYDAPGLTLDLVAWTNDTTRTTALATQNGVLVKTGATGRRYVGSFRTTTVAGNTEDSVVKRFIWNYYNRQMRSMVVFDTTNTWAYTIATFRQARATATNQLEILIGVSEVPVKAKVMARFANSTANVKAAVGIGVDSTSVNSASLIMSANSQVVNQSVAAWAEYNGYPGVGQHEIVWLEWSTATGVTTWEGDNGVADLTIQSGLLLEYLG